MIEGERKMSTTVNLTTKKKLSKIRFLNKQCDTWQAMYDLKFVKDSYSELHELWVNLHNASN